MAATTTIIRPPPPPLLQKLHPPLHKPRVAATRRTSIILFTTASLMVMTKPAEALDFRMTVPDQTLDEAESAIEGHAQSLLDVKESLMAESWREAQRSLRKSSALLKQDMYTIIQSKSPDRRPQLRKLYSDLFTLVTNLDYAARDKDRVRVSDSYHGIVLSLHRILSELLNK